MREKSDEREITGLFGRLRGVGLYVGGERESISVLFTQIKNKEKKKSKKFRTCLKIGHRAKRNKKF